MKYIEDIETENCQLEVYQCECGFHLGIDFTFIDQVYSVDIKCPACRERFIIKEAE